MRYWLIILFLLIATPSWGATLLLKTICSSSCDYTSGEACVNGNEKDLRASTGSDEYLECKITEGISDSTAILIHNYSTDTNHTVRLYTDSSSRHSGVYSESGNYFLSSNSSLYLVSVSSSYVTVDGLVLKNTNNGTYPAALATTASTYPTAVYFKNNIIKLTTNGYGSKGIRFNSDQSNLMAINNIIIGISQDYGSGINAGSGTNAFHAYNNTVYASVRNGKCIDFGSATGAKVKNNLCFNTWRQNSGDVYSLGTTPDAATNGANNADGTPDGLDNLTASNEFTSLTGDGDFHLKSGATSIDAGTDLSATFTTDIDGTTRTGTWDIGADEYVSSGPASHITTLRNSTWRNAVLR